jgi:hypothetical protein
VVVVALAAGCPFLTPSSKDPCADVTCSGRGTCSVVDDQAVCRCNAGFRVEGLTCVRPGDGSVVGQVYDARTNAFVRDATVKLGSVLAHTNEQGYFTLGNVAAGTRVLLDVTAESYARGTKVVEVTGGTSTYVRINLLRFDAEQTFDVAAGGTVAARGATITFPASAFTATGSVTARLAVLDPSIPAELATFPGDFTTDSEGLLESFGAVAIEVEDAAGNTLNLASGKTAQVAIPVRAGSPDTMPLWSFSPTTGVWRQEGNLSGCADGVCDQATITHLSWWNADVVYETTCVNVCIKNPDQTPAVGVSIEATGVDYNGTSSAFSGEDGCACLLVKRNAQVSIVAVFSGGVAGPTTVTTPAAEAQCGSPACLVVADALVVTTPKFQATLTWDEAPNDLDSHLTGPCDPAAEYCEGRFHVYYGNKGLLSGPPWAMLDTDDTTSFGPEITTISQCIAGTYRYAIHNYSGSPDMATSGASVFLLLPDGSARTLPIPTANPSAERAWIVGDLTCTGSATPSTNCACTWQDVNTFGPADDTSYNPPN